MPVTKGVQVKRNDNQENFDFFEELGGVSSQWRYDHLETLDSDDNVGLSQESVHKLSEDIMNPLPPADDDSN